MKTEHGKNVARAQKGNVMTPLNWMCFVFEVILIPTAGLNVNNWLGVGCFVVALCIVFFYGGMYSYFSIKDPDRLQSEHFNLESQKMFVAYEKKMKIEVLNNQRCHIVEPIKNVID